MPDRNGKPDTLEARAQFANNPEPRCPCVLLLDVSWSMEGARLQALRSAVAEFKTKICEDTLTSVRAEIAVVAFSEKTQVVQDFVIAKDFQPPELRNADGTKIGNALIKGLDMVEARKGTYRENGINYYRPIIILITDGYPEHDTDAEIAEATRRVRQAEEGRHAAIFSFGIDEDSDIERLNKIMSPSRPAVGIKHADLNGLFEWLSNSIAAVSTSQPGDRIKLPDMAPYLDY